MAYGIGHEDSNEAAVEYLPVAVADLPEVSGMGRARWSKADDKAHLADQRREDGEWVPCGCVLCRWAVRYPHLMPPDYELLMADEAEWAEIRAAMRGEPARHGGVIVERGGNAGR